MIGLAAVSTPTRTEPMPSQAQVLELLKTVPEPCGLLMREPIDICQMGPGRADRLPGRGGQHRTGPDRYLLRPLRGLQRYITDVVSTLRGVDKVSVTASTTTLWTPDRRRVDAAVR